VPEHPTVGNVAHEELDDNTELVNGLVEARGNGCLRRTPDCLLQVRVRLGVVELHGTDAAEVVVVARVLRVACGCRERRLAHELVRLVVERVLHVRTQQAVDQRGERVVVVAQSSRPLCSKKQPESQLEKRFSMLNTSLTVGLGRGRRSARTHARAHTKPLPQEDPYSGGSGR
jgi:hypothetical protein